MSKKLLIGLTPLLVTVAFAALPAVSQAGAIYKINKTAATTTHVQYVSWGKLKLTNSLGGTPVECENAVGGAVWNEGGVGHEETQGWTAYNCKDEECEKAGGKIGVVFENLNEPEANPVKLDWPGTLVEGSPIRLASTNVLVYVHCNFESLPSEEVEIKEGPAAGLFERISVEVNAKGVSCSANSTEEGSAEGTSKPETLNEEKPATGKTTFSGGAGGELSCSNGGKGVTTGTLKTQGFEKAQEISTEN